MPPTGIVLSPLEQKVLGFISAEWLRLEEIQSKLFPGEPPDSVRRAVAWLRAKELIAVLDAPHGQPLYEATELGQQLLRDLQSREVHHVV